MINVAIDGPAGAGKSTIARGAAAKLNYIYVDTGALYRTVALALQRSGKDCNRENMPDILKTIQINLDFDENGEQMVYLNGENVSSLIRTPEISMLASKVSQFPEVRAFLLQTQRDIAAQNNVIMDGRDIATVVLPNADVKIYLDATAECRAERRFKELVLKGEKVTYEDVLADVNKRDKQDMERELAPLKPAEDSIMADTTNFDLETSIDMVVDIIRNRIGEK